ncbi:MAG: fatty acid desaturase [Saprospiraceae bacterium]|nr:fatty acid desaturase [Saprospiraceae bacterium]
MLEGKELILATRKYAKEDRRRSWFHLLTTCLLIVLAYAGAIVNIHIIPQLLCAVLAALLMSRMFIMYHDYLHKSILQNSVVAKAIFTIYGMFLLAPVSIWKRSHDYHHTHNSKLYTSSIGSFPLVTKNEFLNASPQERRIYLFIRHPLTIAMGYVFVFLWGMCIRTLFRSSQKHLDAFASLVLHFGVATAIWLVFGAQAFLIGFLLPALIYSALGGYLFYAQHNFPGAKYKSKEEWNYVYAALHSSSYMKMSKLMHWFTGNIGYHHIHHINSRIPFYKLPQVFQEMKELQQASTTSLSPADILRCLRLKAWDPETGKMVGLNEIYATA